MLDKSVAITFISALVEVASKKGMFEQIEKDLELVSDVITRHAKLKTVLFHPSIARNEKKNLIKKVFGASVSELMKNFLYILVDRRKEEILELVPEVYKEVLHEKKGVVKARVQTAVPLSGERFNEVEKRLNKLIGKNVELEIVHNPEILGGMIIQVGNTMIDGSVVSRLKNLKTRLLSMRTA
ncbi:MAG TPA: ATP synthase F1 subunit delta [Candidatus Wujingus californicus]|uniref:ATP synthase F1 subunit delta n=1 Tax=Candidatus Wujingus californicus TaxID=3367618 RepID=UPI001D84B6F2|nr:ATP synthase F1 subunit delta [Planctomycetota bacterium]MDO8132184.1 ATP synthase F1 subunit delta [Candidatus Brocadiales bacterium]